MNDSEFFTLFDKVQNSRGYKIETRIVTLQSNFFVLFENYRDMNRVITMTRGEEYIGRMFSSDFSDQILNHVTRLIHNFVASAMMLVDTSRVMIRENYRNTDFINEYQKRIDTTFDSSNLSHFIQDLRNFCLHYKLPITSLNLTVNNTGNGFTENLRYYIERDSIISWDGFSKKGRKYLESQDGNIDIEGLINAYYSLVRDFHIWVHTRLQDIHKDELMELESLRLEAENVLKARGVKIPGSLRKKIMMI